MKTSCLTHPAGDPLLVIHAWQMRACDDEPCAAMLLSLFEFYHNLKLSQQKQSSKMNEVAEAHGDMGQQYTGLLQWHSEDELQKHLLGIYGIKSIRNGLQLLVNKGYISIHSNPNPRYHFDRTRYILFNPEPVQEFIKQYQHPALLPDASGKNASPSGKNAGPIPVFSSETSSEIKDSPTPAELGSDLAAQGERSDNHDGTLRECGTNPRALGTNPRALGTNPRQVTRDTEGACPLCDIRGQVELHREDATVVMLRCPHDGTKLHAVMDAYGYHWPQAPPRTQEGAPHAERTHIQPAPHPDAAAAPDAGGLAAGAGGAGGPGETGPAPAAGGGRPVGDAGGGDRGDQPPACLPLGAAVSGTRPAGPLRPLPAGLRAPPVGQGGDAPGSWSGAGVTPHEGGPAP